MTPVLSDEDLTAALAAAAASYPMSEPGDLAQEMRGTGSVVPMPSRRGVRWLALAAAVVVAVLVTASLTSGHAKLKQTDARGTAAPNDAFNPKGAPIGTTTAGLSLRPDIASTRDSLAAGATHGQAPAATAPAPMALADSARVVKTGSISLVVDDGKVATTMTRLRGVADGAHGYIATEQTTGIGDNPTGTLTMRVPVATFAGVVQQITGKGFGAKVVSSQSSGKDVTAEYADTAAQIASLEAARGRYLTILNAAKSVGEILSVQQRVDDVQGQIDRLEGSRRVLANQSDLATLTVAVNEKAGTVLFKEQSGWSKAWHNAGHGFTSGVESLIAHSGRALLVLIVGLLALLLARSGWRLARRRLI